MKETPLISVIIPCYNKGQYLDECLKSILSQTYTNWECIIVNDGSIDDTEDVAQTWCNKDNRFSYIKKENGGVSSARNLALKKIKGSYIQFLDCDDTIHPEKFYLTIDKFKENNFASVCISSDILIINKNKSKKEIIENLDLNFIILYWNVLFTIPIHAAVFNVSYCKDIYFNEDLTATEDWVWWVSVLLKNDKFLVIDKSLIYYRPTTNGLSADLLNLKKTNVWAHKYLLENVSNDIREKLINKIFINWENDVVDLYKYYDYFSKSKMHIYVEKVMSLYYRIINIKNKK